MPAARQPSPGIRRLLVDQLTEPEPLPTMAAGTSIAEWVSATPEERGGALLDLLELADRLPAPHRAKLTMPPLRGRAGGG